MKRILIVACTLGALAHGYDLLRGPHEHGRIYDMLMHACWVIILLTDMIPQQKTSR